MVKNIVRWILVPVCGFLGVALASVLSLLAKSGLDSFCPPEWRASECMWQPSWIVVLPYALGAGLAAFLLVTLTALMAPTRKKSVAWTVYALGAVCAVAFSLFGMQIQSAFEDSTQSRDLLSVIWVALPGISALICGYLAVVLIGRKLEPHSNNEGHYIR